MSDEKARHVFRLMYALRIALSFSLAWVVSYWCNLDRPYWALMTVIIVSMPGQGAMVSKFFARLAGTLIGALAVNIIAACTLSFPWLMSLTLILWLAACTYAAHRHTGMLTYAFSLAGYTAFILGFGLAARPDAYMVYYFTQARVLEILLGLACPLLIAFLLPSGADRARLKQALQDNTAELLSLFRHSVLLRSNTEDLRKRFATLAGRLGEVKQLVLHDALSPAVKKESYAGAREDAGRQLHLLARFFPLRSLYAALFKTLAPEGQAALETWHDALIAWFDAPKDPGPLPEPPPFLREHSEGARYARLVRETTEALALLRRGNALPPHIPRVPDSASAAYTDHAEALIGVVRAAVFTLAGVAFWLWTQWDVGYILPILIGISLSLGVTYPRPDKLVYLVIAAALLGIVLAALYLFVFYIQAAELAPIMIITVPLIFCLSYLKSKSMLHFIFWHICTLSMIFLVAYDNMMRYDFSRFANISVAAIFSAAFVALTLRLIPLSGAGARLCRVKQTIDGMLGPDARPLPLRDRLAVEAIAYGAMRQSAAALDDAKAEDDFAGLAIASFETMERRRLPA